MRCTKCNLVSSYANLRNGIIVCPECGAVMLGDAAKLEAARGLSTDIRVSNKNGCLNLKFARPVVEVEIEPEMAEKFLSLLQDIVRIIRRKDVFPEEEGHENTKV